MSLSTTITDSRVRRMNSALTARRWAIIVSAALAGVLSFVSMLVDPAPSADGKELLQAYFDHQDRQGIHTNLLHYGFALFAPVAYGMIGLVRGRGAWLANVAGLFAILGLSTLPGLVFIDFAGISTVEVVGLDTAAEIQKHTDTLTWFGIAAAPAFISSLLALPLAALAMWRGRLLPLWVALTVTFAFIGVNAIPNALVGFAVVMVALLVLAWALWRIPRDAWSGRDLSRAAA